MLEVSKRRAQSTKFFFTSDAVLAREATRNVPDEFTLLGSVGISDVLRLVAIATSAHQRNTQRYALCTNSFAGFCLRYRQRPAAHGRKLRIPEFSLTQLLPSERPSRVKTRPVWNGRVWREADIRQAADFSKVQDPDGFFAGAPVVRAPRAPQAGTGASCSMSLRSFSSAQNSAGILTCMEL
jgi:hypothetical protein